jgi:N-acetylglutamate synthase-like GNAT family acetyltransferase
MTDIRPTDDFATLQRLGIAAGLEPAGPSAGERLGLWAAHDGARIVGGVALERIAGLHVVTWLWVAADHRRRGLAAALLDTLEADARRRGIATLWATARAPGIFLRRGYTVVPPGPQRDALLAPCDGCPQRGAACTPEAVVRGEQLRISN